MTCNESTFGNGSVIKPFWKRIAAIESVALINGGWPEDLLKVKNNSTQCVFNHELRDDKIETLSDVIATHLSVIRLLIRSHLLFARTLCISAATCCKYLSTSTLGQLKEGLILFIRVSFHGTRDWMSHRNKINQGVTPITIFVHLTTCLYCGVDDGL